MLGQGGSVQPEALSELPTAMPADPPAVVSVDPPAVVPVDPPAAMPMDPPAAPSWTGESSAGTTRLPRACCVNTKSLALA